MGCVNVRSSVVGRVKRQTPAPLYRFPHAVKDVLDDKVNVSHDAVVTPSCEVNILSIL